MKDLIRELRVLMTAWRIRDPDENYFHAEQRQVCARQLAKLLKEHE
jgi:hypothetical protein